MYIEVEQSHKRQIQPKDPNEAALQVIKPKKVAVMGVLMTMVIFCFLSG